MAEDTLREYLIELGFKVDENKYNKFIKPVTEATRGVRNLGEAAFASASAIYFAVERVSRHFEQLYYASQRTRASVSYLQSYRFAAQQIGLTAEDASSSIESMAAAIRTSPGLGALAGGATNPIELVKRIRSITGGQYFAGAQFASMFGISERTWFHLWNNTEKAEKSQKRFMDQQEAFGVNATKAAVRFTDFSHAVNETSSDLGLLVDRWALHFLPAAEKGNSIFQNSIAWLARVDQSTNGWAFTLGTLLIPSLTATLFKLDNFKAALLILRRLLPLGLAAEAFTLTPSLLKSMGALSPEGEKAMEKHGAGALPTVAMKGILELLGMTPDRAKSFLEFFKNMGAQGGVGFDMFGNPISAPTTAPLGATPGKQGAIINNNVQTTINVTGDTNSSMFAQRVSDLMKVAWYNDVSRTQYAAVR